MTLETPRLLLRPWEESDAQDLFECAKDPRVGPIAGWPAHDTVETSLETIRTVFAVPYVFAVVPKEVGKPVGAISLQLGKNSNFPLPDTEGEIGYWIGVPYWGQGLIPEAVKELLRWGFADLHLGKIWCGYFEGNEKSWRVQEKCGFTYHHTNRDVPWPLTGDTRTEHISCLTRQDWAAGQQENPLHN